MSVVDDLLRVSETERATITHMPRIGTRRYVASRHGLRHRGIDADAAEGATAHGIRAVELRIGVVFGPGGGALEQLARPFKLFAGGPIGDGKQVMSWVHRDDVVGMILFGIDNDAAKGPINAVSPYAATNREVADALGVVLGRPSFFPTPAAVVGLMLGEAASIVTTGQRVFPKKAAELGYEFRHARLVPALESILGE